MQGTGRSRRRVTNLFELKREGIRNLPPAYFAVVMATSSVAIACSLENFGRLAQALTVVNACAFVVLVILLTARLILFRGAVYADLMDHARAPGFFTVAAGSALLGGQLILIFGSYTAAFILFFVGVVSWMFLTYGIFAGLTIKENKPPLDQGINGGWLIAVVATQAVAQLSLLLIPALPIAAEVLLFAGLVLWLWGGMLYIWMIALIFYRYTFFAFSPSDLMPPYWINMGAMAISTLVGALLVQRTSDSILSGLVPFVKGFTIFFWATATWWIPMLVILGVWRHLIKRFPLACDPLYWGAVFPLGVYTVATYELADFTKLTFLFWVPRVFVYIALGAWLATFSGMVRAVLKTARSRP